MRTDPFKLRCPILLVQSLKVRALEAGYKNVSSYVLGLVRYDLLTRKPHTQTVGIEALSRAEQDKIDIEIARMFETGETVNGSWFEHRLEEAVESTGAGDVPADNIVQKLLKRIQSNG